jgi:transcriptional regulator with GAF, ATPase, and Fis domain/tetratricopeptide (TPR) repeat protein
MERFADRYLLLRSLGRGGMGEVFLARDLVRGTECALKRLNAGADDDSAEQFRREFERHAAIRHPAIAQVYERGTTPDGTPYITMEYVPGLPSDHAIAAGDRAGLAFVAARVAAGLEALHAAGILHGDMKPTNVLVVPAATAGRPPLSVRIVDFGLAGLLGRDTKAHEGTPGYAAPEVVTGTPASAVTDLYGLGATLYHLAAGRPPFADEKPATLLRRQQAAPPPALPLEEAGCPAAMIQLILRLMAVAPGERPQTAGEVRRELEPMHPAARQSLADRLATDVIVGRERELGLIERRLAEAGKRTRVLLLTGEPGAGKSSLLRELATRAALRDQRVVHCSGAGAPARGGAALELLRMIAAGTTPADPEQRAIRERLDDPDAALPEQAVPATVAAAIHWMRRGPDAGLFLIDDAEQMDSLSRTVVRRLMLHPEAPPSLWVVARRGDAGALAEDEALMVRAGVAEHLPVRTLSRDSMARLAAVRLAHPAPEPLVEFLWDRAAGHPGLTVELLRAAAESGALREADTGLGLDAEALAKVATPGSFEETLLGRLNTLPEPARATALALAIWRRPVAMDRLRAVAPRATETAVDALIDSGLAALDDAGRIGLRPPALAERVIEAANTEVRQRVHRAILELPGLAPAERFEHFRMLGDIEAALAEADLAFAGAPDAVLAAAAADLAAPSDPAGAARWYERAATERFRQGRAAEVLPLIEQAMTLDPESESRFTRWILLARAQQRAGAPDEALDTIEVAMADEPDDAKRARLLVARSSSLVSLGKIDLALELSDEALALRSAGSDDETVVAANLNRSGCFIFLDRLGEAGKAASAARTAAAQIGDPFLEATALGNLAIIETLQGRRDEAVDLGTQAVTAARKCGNQVALLLQLTGLGSMLTEAGRWAAARERHLEAFRIGVEQGLKQGAAQASLNLLHAEALAGRPKAAARYAKTALRLARAYHPRFVPDLYRGAASAARVSGKISKAARLIRRAIAIRSEAIGPNDLDWQVIEHARILLAQGRPAEAVGVAGARLENTRGRGVGPVFLQALAGVAHARAGALPEAEAALRSVRSLMRPGGAPYAEALTRLLEGLIHFGAGRRDEGVRAADAALRGFDQLPAPPDRAWAAYELARAALGMSEPPAQIGLWLEGAARIFERLGDDRSRARALSLQIRWLRRTGVGPGVADEQHLIEQVSAMLGSFSNPAEVSHRAMAMVVQQLGAERGSLLIIDRESNRLIPVAEIGALDSADKKEVFNYSRQVVKRVTESGVGLVTGDAATDPGLGSPSIRTLGLRSIVCVPVHLGGRVIGAIYADDSRRTGAFSEQDQSLLEGLSHLMAIAIERSREHVEVLATNVRLVDENLSLRRQVGAHHQMDNLVGTSTQMRRVIAEVEQAAGNDARVLVTGEMGTGKELVARTLHYRSRRRMGPFVMLNCGAITETLLASELFGILPDVATGVKARAGRFAEASGGTLFLDEVGEMPMAQQVALLSVLSSPSTKCEVTPVGGGKPVQVDVRVIAATNQDLRARIREGKFREDLFYRLAVIPIDIPPLRERKADIQPLAIRFLGDLATAQQRKTPDMSPEFVAALLRSDWPGNVRELQNYVERVLAMTPGHVLEPKPLPRDLEERAGTVRLKAGRRLGDMVEELERKLIREALDRADGNQSRAARELGLTEQSMRYRIKKYTLESAREKQRTR